MLLNGIQIAEKLGRVECGDLDSFDSDTAAISAVGSDGSIGCHGIETATDGTSNAVGL